MMNRTNLQRNEIFKYFIVTTVHFADGFVVELKEQENSMCYDFCYTCWIEFMIGDTPVILLACLSFSADSLHPQSKILRSNYDGHSRVQRRILFISDKTTSRISTALLLYQSYITSVLLPTELNFEGV
jgi:hypothetical protein